MVRKLAVLIFILAITGQVAAAVCDCIQNPDGHVCCEKQTRGPTSLSSRRCCAQNCLTLANDTLLQNRIENTIGIFATVGPSPVHTERRFGPSPPFSADISTPHSSSQIEPGALKKLYLHNHTLRI